MFSCCAFKGSTFYDWGHSQFRLGAAAGCFFQSLFQCQRDLFILFCVYRRQQQSMVWRNTGLIEWLGVLHRPLTRESLLGFTATKVDASRYIAISILLHAITARNPGHPVAWRILPLIIPFLCFYDFPWELSSKSWDATPFCALLVARVDNSRQGSNRGYVKLCTISGEKSCVVKPLDSV